MSADGQTDCPSVLDDAHTRTLLAVIDQTHPTCRSVAAATNVAPSTAYYRLTTLRDAGLVGWEPRRKGTMRALVPEVRLLCPENEMSWAPRERPQLRPTPQGGR